MIKERKLPTDAEIVERLRERLAVKVEQEIRHLSTTASARCALDRFLPGRRARWSPPTTGGASSPRSARCYLREHRPETPASDAADPNDDRPEHRAPRRDGGGGGGGGGRGRGREGGRGGGAAGAAAAARR